MKNVFKWRIVTNKYLYITDEDGNAPFLLNKGDGKRTYPSDSVPSNIPEKLDEGAIGDYVSKINNASTYKIMFDNMVNLAMTDDDAKKVAFMPYSDYFNIDDDECLVETVTPGCECYEPVFNISAHTIDETEVSYTFTSKRNEYKKTLEYDLNLGIPRGEKGEPGEAGASGYKGDKGEDGKNAEFDSIDLMVNTVPSGSVASGIIQSGITEDGKYTILFNLDIPRGERGAVGASGDKGDGGYDARVIGLNIGKIETLEPNGVAYVTSDNVDVVKNEEDKTWDSTLNLNFGIPKGSKGDIGEPGSDAEITGVTCNVETLDYSTEVENDDGTVSEVINNAACTVTMSPENGGNRVGFDFDFKIPKGKPGDNVMERGAGENSVQVVDNSRVVSRGARGIRSASFGENTLASGTGSFSEGKMSVAKGNYSHSEGWGTQANGLSSHAGGFRTTTRNMAEHAIGSLNISHSQDSSNFDETFSGNTLFSIGNGSVETTEIRKNAVEVMQNGDVYVYGIGGYDGTEIKNPDNQIKTLQEVAGKISSSDSNDKLFLIGAMEQSDSVDITHSNIKVYTKGSTLYSNNICIGDANITDGFDGSISHGVGSGITANGYGAYAGGAIESGAIIADSDGTMAFGYVGINGSITSSGYGSYAGGYSEDENQQVLSSGNGSFSHGAGTKATGNGSASFGIRTQALGDASHTEGMETRADNIGCHSEGIGTITTNIAEHAEGNFNVSHSNDASKFGDNSGNTVSSIGIGYEPSNRKNAVEVMQNGDVYVYRVGQYDGNIVSEKTLPLQEAISEASSKVGATNSAAKMFLIGSVTQEGSVTSYSNSQVYAENGNLQSKNLTVGSGVIGNGYTGSISSGYGSGITANDNAAFALGYSDGGEVISNNQGALAHGYVGESSHIEAGGAGSMAGGYAESGGTIYSDGYGAHAVGYASQSGFSVSETNDGGSITHQITAPEVISNGLASFSHGIGTKATGDGSTSFGINTTANRYGMTAIGRYNTTADTTGYLFVVGNGEETSGGTTLSDAFFVKENGDCYASGAYYASSDARKKDITDSVSLEKAYELVEKCQSVYFTWKDDKEKKRQIGMIAQEVRDVFPELVYEDGEGYLSLDYSKLTVILLTVIKDLKERVDKIVSIEERLSKLEGKH